MKIHYTREKSEINRKAIFDLAIKYKNYGRYELDINDIEDFRTKICEYHKEIIIINYQIIKGNIYVAYYDTNEKLFGVCFFEFIERKDNYKFEEMEQTTYEKIKDKIETKKTTFK